MRYSSRTMPDSRPPSEPKSAPAEPNAVVFDWRRLHIWQIQPVRDVLFLAAIFGVLYLGYRVSLVTVPILLALLLAYLFEPVVKRLTRVKWISRQGAAVFIIIATTVAIVVPLALAVSFGVAQGVNLAQGLVRNVDAVQASIAKPEDEQLTSRVPGGAWMGIRNRVVELRKAHADEGISAEHAEPELKLLDWGLSWLDANAEAVVKSVARETIGTGSDAVTALVRSMKSIGLLGFTGFLTAFFFYFFCTGWGRVLVFTKRFIPDQKKNKTIELLKMMDAVIAGFIRGRLIICAVQCVFFSVGYWIIGVPAPFIIGIVVGLLAIAPYLGGVVGVPLTLLLIWLDPPTGFRSAWWWLTFGPFVVYQIGQMLDDYVLTPRIQGKATDLDTPSILFASITGGVLAGFYGLLLAIPVAACIKILLREVAMPRVKAWVEGRAMDPLPFGAPSNDPPKREPHAPPNR